jgi:hypothetical protein
MLGNLFGWGDYEAVPPVNYEVASNTTVGMQTPMASQIPMMHTEDGSTRIKKREYIGDIPMTPGFARIIFTLNPTSPQTFPWLSTIAANYEQYKFLGVSFGFRSLTANALGSTGNPALGSITLATQYDVYDTPITTKVQANNALFSTSCKPSESMLHPIECDPEQTPSQPLYTGINEASGPTGPFPDLRLKHMAFTSVITQGGPPEGTYLCGELWITYDIMLYKPMIKTGVPTAERVSILEAFECQEAAIEAEVPESGFPNLQVCLPPETPRQPMLTREGTMSTSSTRSYVKL